MDPLKGALPPPLQSVLPDPVPERQIGPVTKANADVALSAHAGLVHSAGVAGGCLEAAVLNLLGGGGGARHRGTSRSHQGRRRSKRATPVDSAAPSYPYLRS